MSARIVKRVITIRELPNSKGWLWLERDTRRGALGDMLRLIRREDKELIKNGAGAVVNVITYEPVTSLGTMVVKVLTKE